MKDMMMMDMKMYFHVGYETNVVFFNWSPQSVWEMVMTCIVFCVASILYEYCKHLRLKIIATKRSNDYERMTDDKGQQGQQEQTETNDNDQEAGTSSVQVKKDKQQPSLSSRSASYLRSLKCPCHVKQSAMYVAEVIISLVLMLAIMTFNIWICVSVVFGRGAGYFLFSKSTNRLIVGGQDADCCI